MTEGLKWDDDLIFSMTWMVYGVSYSAIQYFYVDLQKKYGAFATGALGCFIKIIGCALVPLLTILCKDIIKLNETLPSTQWIELMIHVPASILNGIGYGLCNTTTQTVISDYAKRYNVRSVGNWLGCWMASVALGAAGVILLGAMSQKIGTINTFYFCSLLAFIAFITFCYLSIVARDIKIIVDVKQVINDNEELGEKLEKLVHDDYIEKSMSRASTLSPTMGALNAPLTPNLHRISSNIMRKQEKRHSTASCLASDDRLTTAGSLYRNVTDSITRSSLTQSLSSFNVSTPFGPLPIATPSQLIGVPMISSKIFDGKKHIDLKNAEINIITLTPRSSMKSLDLEGSHLYKDKDKDKDATK